MPTAAGLPVSAALTGGYDHVNGFQIVRIGLGAEQIVDVCEYPDSGKINILPAMDIFEAGSKVRYYSGKDGVRDHWPADLVKK